MCERCDNCADLRADLIHAENRADEKEQELDRANDKIDELEKRIAKLSEKINELYQMAD